MRKVAARCELSATAIYRHYDDKDALLVSIVVQSFELFSAYLMRSLSGKTPLERFELTARAYFDFAIENERDYQLIFMTDCRDLGFLDLSAGTRENLGNTYRFLLDRLRECSENGDFRYADLEAAGVFVWAQNHGLVSLRLTGQLGEERAMFESLVDRSIRGVVQSLSA